MRDAFISELMLLAREDPTIFLATGDLGFSVIEEFAAEFPDRFLNAGVAEQTMMGVAAGLASDGFNVFVYSIGNFPTMRCLEQIRNDVCYHNQSVTIVAVGAGFSYGSLGYTHHAIEDLAVMRALPNMSVYSPSDPQEARALTRKAASNPGPVYLRLGKNGEARLHDEALATDLPPTLTLLEGTDITIMATGSIIEVAINAREQLAREGIDARVVSVPIVKPFDSSVLAAAVGTAAIITVEEHSLIGGLGSAILERAALERNRTPIFTIGISEATLGQFIGSHGHMREKNGLTADAICSVARESLGTR